MASWFPRQPSNVLEIRGISRGSLIDHPKVETINDVLTSSREITYYDSMIPSVEIDSDDDDDSTVVGETFRIDPGSPRNPSHTDDTVTASDTSHYWLAENSFTTGNTTERSSVYSWGDDEFDVQTSRMVREMFQAIERLLFEGVLSGSTSLQQECREWIKAFPHLRILGKQVLPSRDEGFEALRPSGKGPSKPATIPAYTNDVLEVRGSPATPSYLPPLLLASLDQEGERSTATSAVSHLYEEIFAQDGKIEEYLAYDIREMDEDEHCKKYHVPRRRRFGFLPITPNACVRDTVMHQVFDSVWCHVVSCLSSTENKPASILKLLIDNHIWSHDKSSQESALALLKHNQSGGMVPGRTLQFVAEEQENAQLFEDEAVFNRFDLPFDRHRGSVGVQLLAPTLPHRLFYPDSIALPPSRGSYLDQPVAGGRHTHLASGRLSTAPYQTSTDINSLNDLMKISQKKLQTRVDRLANDEVSADSLQDPVPRFASSTQFFNGSNQNHASLHSQLSVVGQLGSPSPLTASTRQVASKDLTFRQQSASGRKGRGRGRLMPLDRSKTPNVDHNDLNVTATKLLPGHLEPTSQVGFRVSSPTNAFHPPPTAPTSSAGLGPQWFNPKLPPITSNLESLPENTSSDFKKTRGKTAHTRISSAVADEKFASRALEAMSRPSTTHTFRAENFSVKRSASVTPSNFMFGAQGNSILNPGLKPNSPAAASYNIAFPYHSAGSPDHFSGLAGITGRSINLSNVVQPSSPDDTGPAIPHSSWGLSSQTNFPQARRRRPPML